MKRVQSKLNKPPFT